MAMEWNAQVVDGCRRRVLAGAFVASSSWTALPTGSTAAPPANSSEAIRRSAANIPGYGQTDVFYPLGFFGKWNVKREIVACDEVEPSKLPFSLNYEMRFIKSTEDTAVVSDRGFNEVEFVNAFSGNKVRTYQWTESDPNDLKLIFDDGCQRDLKVTERATERTNYTISSSEFQRITQEDAGGIPVISARRVLQKWRVVNDDIIEAIEIVYDAGGGLGDPLAMTSAPTAPRIIQKSRLSLQHIQ
jgi:hypothetical protein